VRNDHYANMPYLKTAVANNFMSRNIPKETSEAMVSSMRLPAAFDDQEFYDKKILPPYTEQHGCHRTFLLDRRP
jgi:hypothetical protein